MKVKVGDTGDEIEIGQYRAIDKNSLKGFFSMVIYSEGSYSKQLKILDCKHFENGKNKWFAFPQKELKKSDGSKSDYMPLLTLGDKQYEKELKEAVMEALKTVKPQENYARKNNSYPSRTPSVSPYSSFDGDSGEMPF